MLIFRKETFSSLGLMFRNEPEGSRYGSVSEAGPVFRAWPEDERGSVPGAVVWDWSRSEVRDERGSELGGMVGDGRGS